MLNWASALSCGFVNCWAVGYLGGGSAGKCRRAWRPDSGEEGNEHRASARCRKTRVATGAAVMPTLSGPASEIIRVDIAASGRLNDWVVSQYTLRQGERCELGA